MIIRTGLFYRKHIFGGFVVAEGGRRSTLVPLSRACRTNRLIYAERAALSRLL